jgi:shikimate kinase
MLIVLIGYRGTGKTTVARLLAEKLSMDWVDADVEIERRAGKTIAEIFSSEGEGAFRDLESEVTADLASREKLVIAAGGGAVMREENRAALEAADAIVWLKADAEAVFQRTSADATSAARRPNLTSTGGIGEIRQLLALREPIYRQCATCQVDTVGKSPANVVDEILSHLDGPA